MCTGSYKVLATGAYRDYWRFSVSSHTAVSFLRVNVFAPWRGRWRSGVLSSTEWSCDEKRPNLIWRPGGFCINHVIAETSSPLYGPTEFLHGPDIVYITCVSYSWMFRNTLTLGMCPNDLNCTIHTITIIFCALFYPVYQYGCVTWNPSS
jgi:hypothetical protein